jgi:hypothetical protein
MRRSFHVALHALPAGEIPKVEDCAEGRQITRLHLSAQQLIKPLAISFERAVEELAALPRMFVEPDGSFIWVCDTDIPPWQLNGVLFDRGGQLQYVELRGTCGAEAIEELAQIFRRGETGLAVQLMQQAVFLSEQEFRRLVWD